MNILCLVSDLVLDFANKIAKVKCDGSSDNERENIKDDFLSKILLLRERYPELLFVNYPSDINKDEADGVFRKIKESVTDVYQLDNIVCPQFRSFVIDGFKLELPGIEWGGYEDYGSVFNIDYDSVENKVACINQTLLHCLILLPIKKITITFVDPKIRR